MLFFLFFKQKYGLGSSKINRTCTLKINGKILGISWVGPLLADGGIDQQSIETFFFRDVSMAFCVFFKEKTLGFKEPTFG